MTAIETFEQGGFTASIFHDDDAESPDSWDQLATFEHSSGYTFGEPMRHAPERGWSVYIRALGIFGDDIAGVVPVRVDDYGSRGVTISESDAANANGVLYTTHKRVTELCGDDAPSYHARAWVEDALRGELAEWKQYAEGDVYGYNVDGPDGETLDSCWGFYGYEYAEQEARSALEQAIKDEHAEKGKIARVMAL